MSDEIRVRFGAPRPDGERPRPMPITPKRVVDDMKPSPSSMTNRPVPAQELRPETTAEPLLAAPTIDDSTDAPEAPETAAQPPVAKSNGKGNIFAGYWRHKLWTLPLTILVIAGAFMAVPTTRYKVLAYFISRPLVVTVIDSTSSTPVSGATIKVDGKTETTNGSGEIKTTLPVGDHTLSVTKTYYKSLSQSVFVDVSGTNSVTLHMTATGRQVPLKVINKITGKAIPEAQFTIGAATARSDLNGLVTVVIPASPAMQAATITADGYTDLAAQVTVTTEPSTANTFAMVPKGRIYFLSNQSGSIDVVSTNLDGSGRKTIVAGTGKEDKNNTVLLASRDWKFLALLSRRDGGSDDHLFLINTATRHLVTIDDTEGYYTLAGWNGHNFVYQVNPELAHQWQNGQALLMSYNADKAKDITLAKSKAMGTSDADAEYQSFDQPILLGTNLIYAANWYDHDGNSTVTGQKNTLSSVKVDGSGSRTVESVASDQFYVASLTLANPSQLYFGIYGVSSGANYYRLDTSGNATQSSTITADSVNENYPTYLQSPSGVMTFWTSVRDGKNTLFVGNANGASGAQIAGASDYSPYGWFTDEYVLVQKNDSELYIMGKDGGTPLKISDYFKPDYYIYGYGGGYGGL